jgi:hypothetical protein
LWDWVRQVTIEAIYVLIDELEAGQPQLHPRLQAGSATQNVPFGVSSVITEAGHLDVPNERVRSASTANRAVAFRRNVAVCDLASGGWMIDVVPGIAANVAFDASRDLRPRISAT